MTMLLLWPKKSDKLNLTLQNSNQTKSSIIKKSLQSGQVKLKNQATVATLNTQKEVIEKMQQQLTTLAEQVGTQAAGQPSLADQTEEFT